MMQPPLTMINWLFVNLGLPDDAASSPHDNWLCVNLGLPDDTASSPHDKLVIC